VAQRASTNAPRKLCVSPLPVPSVFWLYLLAAVASFSPEDVSSCEPAAWWRKANTSGRTRGPGRAPEEPEQDYGCFIQSVGKPAVTVDIRVSKRDSRTATSAGGVGVYNSTAASPELGTMTTLVASSSMHEVPAGTNRGNGPSDAKAFASNVSEAVLLSAATSIASSDRGADATVTVGTASAIGSALEGLNHRVASLGLRDPFIWVVILVCAIGCFLACWGVSRSASFGEQRSKDVSKDVGGRDLGADQAKYGKGPRDGRFPEARKTDYVDHAEIMQGLESVQSLDSVQFQPRLPAREGAGPAGVFRRDPSVPALSLAFAKATPQPPTPEPSPRTSSQQYYSRRVSGRNLPPPLCPTLVLPQCEARFAVPLHTLAQIDIGEFNVVGPSGAPLLFVVVRRTLGGKVLELSLAHAPNPPHATVGPPSQRGLQICGAGGAYYGLLEPQASGAYTVTHGTAENSVMCVDVAGRLLSVTSPNGHPLATASISTFGDVEHLGLKVHNGVDSVLVIACVLAIFLLGSCQ